MAKKAATNPAPEPVVSEAPETEATTSAAMDQPAVSVDASASSPSDLSEPVAESSSSPAEPAAPAVIEPVVEPAVEHKGGGGSFESPFAEEKPAPTMIERIELLEKRVAELESK